MRSRASARFDAPTWNARLQFALPLGISAPKANVARQRLLRRQTEADLKAPSSDRDRRHQRGARRSATRSKRAGGDRGPRALAEAARGGAEQVRGRHVDQLRSGAGAARPRRRAQPRAARDAELPRRSSTSSASQISPGNAGRVITAAGIVVYAITWRSVGNAELEAAAAVASGAEHRRCLDSTVR